MWVRGVEYRGCKALGHARHRPSRGGRSAACAAANAATDGRHTQGQAGDVHDCRGGPIVWRAAEIAGCRLCR